MENKIEYKGYTIEIEQDQFADDPRNWDNLGTIVYKHRDYKIGDKEIPEYWTDDQGKEQYITDKKSLDEWLQHEYGKIALQLPIDLYDHSGLRLKVGSFQGLLPEGHAEFDSGQVGIIFVTQDKLKEEKLTVKQAEKTLRAEIETLDQYVSGDVYTSYVYESKTCDKCGHTELEQIDGSGDIFGYDEALQLAKDTIDRLSTDTATVNA